jgi:hypothetical protein
MSSMEIEEAGPPPTVANKVYQCGKLTGAKVKSLKSVMFKDPNGFFELNRGALEHFVDWPDLKSYAEVTSGIRRFRISLIGIEASVSGSIGSPVIAKRRETARALVKSLYLANFNAAPADAAAIDTAVNSCQTLALLVSRGKAPRSITRRRNQPANSIQSIFDLVDDDVKGGSSLECIGAITVSVCTNFQVCSLVSGILNPYRRIPVSILASLRCWLLPASRRNCALCSSKCQCTNSFFASVP